MTRGSNTRQVAPPPHNASTRVYLHDGTILKCSIAFKTRTATNTSIIDDEQTNRRKAREENVSQALVIFLFLCSFYLLNNYLQFDYRYRTKTMITTTKLVIHTITITKAAAGQATRLSHWYVFYIFISLESLGVITEEI